MADNPGNAGEVMAAFLAALCAQAEAVSAVIQQLFPAADAESSEASRWAESGRQLQALWQKFVEEKTAAVTASGATPDWPFLLQTWQAKLPGDAAERQQRLFGKLGALWQAVLGQVPATGLPRSDRRFGAEEWRDNPYFALLHQAHLLFGEEVEALVAESEGLDPAKQAQLGFFTSALVDALSPANFLLTNPQVLARAEASEGDSLVKGLGNLLEDIKRGQLTHSDPAAFRIGETIAATPGKVVHQTPLYQLIQYSPTTDKVLVAPLVIFPPWINRFYILDLSPEKSFVRWAVEQGITVFMVSWKSADESMADVIWDDYIAAQIDAVDHIRQRLKVPSVHAIGYCVAGTTLAATLAIAARRGEADRFKSATFFTAQVDFTEAGDLKHFVDDQQIAVIGKLAPQGFLDGRYMALTFNLLRSRELLWAPAIKHYLLGEDRPAFDLLHWNGDVTNLPAKWHEAYLRDLYQDNMLVVPDALSALGTAIDLRHIATPAYIQAGREDHIAPPQSVWKLTQHLAGPWTFVLAGSGHIAGVVNPPSSGKYQHWTNPDETRSLADFTAGAEEHKGSWWPHWAQWLRALDPTIVTARGKRMPGAKGKKPREDAPGSYVRQR